MSGASFELSVNGSLEKEAEGGSTKGPYMHECMCVDTVFLSRMHHPSYLCKPTNLINREFNSIAHILETCEK